MAPMRAGPAAWLFPHRELLAEKENERLHPRIVMVPELEVLKGIGPLGLEPTAEALRYLEDRVL